MDSTIGQDYKRGSTVTPGEVGSQAVLSNQVVLPAGLCSGEAAGRDSRLDKTVVRQRCRLYHRVDLGCRIHFMITEASGCAPPLGKVSGWSLWSGGASSCILHLGGARDCVLWLEAVGVIVWDI